MINRNPHSKRRITIISFSSGRNEERILENIASGMGLDHPARIAMTLLGSGRDVRHAINRVERTTEYWLIGSPVHFGRIPCLVRKEFAHLDGQFKPTVAVVAGGKGDHEAALRQLVETLTGRNYWVVGAAAFLAEGPSSPVFPHAFGRSDQQDLEIARSFGEGIMAKDTCQTSVSPDRIGCHPHSLFNLFSGSRTGISDICEGCLVCDDSSKRTDDGTTQERCFTCISCQKGHAGDNRIFRVPDVMVSLVSNHLLKGMLRSRRNPLLLL